MSFVVVPALIQRFVVVVVFSAFVWIKITISAFIRLRLCNTIIKNILLIPTVEKNIRIYSYRVYPGVSRSSESAFKGKLKDTTLYVIKILILIYPASMHMIIFLFVSFIYFFYVFSSTTATMARGQVRGARRRLSVTVTCGGLLLLLFVAHTCSTIMAC